MFAQTITVARQDKLLATTFENAIRQVTVRMTRTTAYDLLYQLQTQLALSEQEAGRS